MPGSRNGRDEHALASLAVIGEDNVLWESDYPHESTTFPHSRSSLEASMRHIPDATARKVAESNARRLFGI